MSGKNRILVTGCAGFIGSKLMSKFMNLGIHVLGVDNFSHYYAPSMKFAREAYFGLTRNTLNIDITNQDHLRRIFKEFEPTIVINLAAQGGVRASRSNPLPYLEANQVGFLNLIELSRDFGVSKFLYASSSSVYGDTTPSPFKESALLPCPKSLYALSKISNEIIAENLRTPNMKKIGLRFFTVYGPWGRPDMAMFRLLASAILTKEFRLTASRQVERDFTYIEDLCLVVEQLATSYEFGLEHEIFNVAGGKPYCLNDLFLILGELGVPLKIIDAEHDSLDVRITNGSVEKLIEAKLPVPSTSLTEGVRRTLDWIFTIKKTDLSEWYDHNS